MRSPKEQLLAAAVDYFVAHGIANLSLRPLAAKLGTSPRMLLFHFESKERLIRAVLEELNARLRASFAATTHGDTGSKSPIRCFWDWATNRRHLPALRLLYELQILAIQNPKEYGRYLKQMSLDWQAAALGAMSEPMRGEHVATLCIAVFDGLFLELMSTGDHARLTHALDLFVAMARTADYGGDK